MPFGFRTILKKLIIIYDLIIFFISKKLFGFDNATKILYDCLKESVIPILKANGATIGFNCDIESPLIFHNAKDFSNLVVGNNCHIGKKSFFDLRSKIEIGDNVTLSMNVSIMTHIELGQAEMKYLYETEIKEVIIEDGVYVGANCVILMGVIISQNSLIGAQSLVNKSIPENCVAYGNPAKVVKSISVT
jgi:acetyltransferase-like isoleucine patch superfamily enzyme